MPPLRRMVSLFVAVSCSAATVTRDLRLIDAVKKTDRPRELDRIPLHFGRIDGMRDAMRPEQTAHFSPSRPRISPNSTVNQKKPGHP